MESSVEIKESPYGYCPHCGANGARRERRLNGDDTCEKGHTYPSKDAIMEKTLSMRVGEVFRRIIPIIFITLMLSGCGEIASKVQQRQMVIEDAKTSEVFDLRTFDNIQNPYFLVKETDGSIWVYHFGMAIQPEKTMIFAATK